MRVRARFMCLVLAALPPLAGCASTAVGEVNDVVMAKWESLTDAASRRRIHASLRAAPRQREDYRVGPEDVLAISIFEWELREETRTLEVRVPQSGAVSLPLIGDLVVAGRTTDQIRARIEAVLAARGILKRPHVTVVIKEYQSKRIAVVGAVKDPGVYTLHQNVSTLLDVLSLAGGPDERAGQIAYVMRAHRGSAPTGPDPETGSAPPAAPAAARPQIAVDLYELLELGNLSLNMVVEHGDLIHVPEAHKFYVFGYVREPGGFPLKRPTTVLDAVALARGLREREASPEHCILKRRTPGGEVVIPINLVDIARGVQPNHFLQAGDIIEVQQSTNKGFFLSLWEGLKSILSLGIGVRAI